GHARQRQRIAADPAAKIRDPRVPCCGEAARAIASDRLAAGLLQCVGREEHRPCPAELGRAPLSQASQRQRRACQIRRKRLAQFRQQRKCVRLVEIGLGQPRQDRAPFRSVQKRESFLIHARRILQKTGRTNGSFLPALVFATAPPYASWLISERNSVHSSCEKYSEPQSSSTSTPSSS